MSSGANDSSGSGDSPAPHHPDAATGTAAAAAQNPHRSDGPSRGHESGFRVGPNGGHESGFRVEPNGGHGGGTRESQHSDSGSDSEDGDDGFAAQGDPRALPDTEFDHFRFVELGRRKQQVRVFSKGDPSKELFCLSDCLVAAGQAAGSVSGLRLKLGIRLKREGGGVSMGDLVFAAQHLGKGVWLHVATAETAVMLLECIVADSHDRSRKEAAAGVVAQLRAHAGLVSGVAMR